MKKEFVNVALYVCRKAVKSLLRKGIIDADEMKKIDKGCLIRKHDTSPEVDKFIEMEKLIA